MGAAVGITNPRRPERRLPDARLPFEEQGGGAVVDGVQEGTECREFLVPADDLAQRRSPSASLPQNVTSVTLFGG